MDRMMEYGARIEEPRIRTGPHTRVATRARGSAFIAFPSPRRSLSPLFEFVMMCKHWKPLACVQWEDPELRDLHLGPGGAGLRIIMLYGREALQRSNQSINHVDSCNLADLDLYTVT